LLVPNAALRYKPANIETQKAPVNPAQTAGTGSYAQNSSVSPGGSQGGKLKRDAFSGKVYVLENDKLKPASVTLGITDNRNTEITGGDLKVGDQIVIGEEQASEKQGNSGSRPPLRMF